MSNIHYLEPQQETLHGYFSRDLQPCLTIESGDTVRATTLDAAWGLGARTAPGVRREKFPIQNPEEHHRGHSLIGPLFINGAEPGMTLEIKINEVVPTHYGWASAGGFPSYWNQKMGTAELPETQLDFALDTVTMTGRSLFGNFPHEVALRPFMGVMGMPPDEPGHHPTTPPRHCGGNIDCKELVAGSTLYLPITVPGALFSFGDGHAVQGDGEVSGPALECGMDRVDLTLTVRDDMKVDMPRAKTPIGWLTFGLHEDLDEAMWMALDGMLDLMGELYGLSRTEAYAMASLVVDLRVTQIVNKTKGVHAVLPYGAIKQS